ncbi:hypothetical protein LWI29_008854 [Acer saccharum]|uniref:Uncharacterized protein n=1 Tax=Acer saccharum TaxID=4024 RepID=A0AA39SUG3_ACESA|nr:hypothetical protein LWI29_008854 [Acer saccharum]
MATKGRIDMLVRFSCLLLLLTGNSYSQRDKLLQADELKDGDDLLSAFGKFIAAGIVLLVPLLCYLCYKAWRKLKAEDTKIQVGNPSCSTPKRYIGIWYHRATDTGTLWYPVWPVWVVNRDAPIFDTSGNLTTDPTDGNLKIFHTGGNPIAKTSVQGASNNTSASVQLFWKLEILSCTRRIQMDR